MKTLILALIMALLPLSALAQDNVVVLDVEYVIQNSQEGKRAKKKMEKLLKKAQADQKKEYEALIAERNQLQKKLPILNEQAKVKHQRELEQKFVAFQKKQYESQQILSKKEDQLTRPILDKIEKIVTAYGQKNKLDLILEQSRGSVLFAAKKKDITEIILNIYNKKHKSNYRWQK